VTDLVNRIIEAGQANEAKAGPCPYPVGSTVRVLRRVIEDGVTPRFWAGARAVVESAHIAPGRSFWRLILRHTNGQAARFDEGELDRRYGPRAGAS
jgi:hypothetical protein